MAKTAADPTEYLASLFAAGQQMMNPFTKLPDEADVSAPSGKAAAAGKAAHAGEREQPAAAPAAGAPAADTPAAIDPFAAFAQATKTITDLQQDYLRQVTNFWMSLPA